MISLCFSVFSVAKIFLVACLMKLTVIFPNFGPYHLARLRAAASGPFASVTGLEIAAQEALYPWQTARENLGFALDTLLDGTLEAIAPGLICRQLETYLDAKQPDVVAICGYERPEMRAALKWANRHRRIAVLMSESKRDDAPRAVWKEAIKKRIVSKFDAALVGGAPHKAYLEKLGIPARRIFCGYDVVDNQGFAARAQTFRAQPAPIERPYFLTVNRFIARKNLARVIEAWAAYRAAVAQFPDQTPWDLVLCGAGEEDAKLRQIARATGWDGVHFTGFAQEAEVSRWMAHAGAFIHASLQEQWGLVVNEAMACGLPMLLSQSCGCAPELLEDGRNGWGFDPCDVAQLSALMARMAGETGADGRAKMGAASREIVARWGPGRFARGLWECAHCVG